MNRSFLVWSGSILLFSMLSVMACGQEEKKGAQELPITEVDAADTMALMQFIAHRDGKADWGYWGANPETYHGWTSHSNRLIPVYSFGATLESYKDAQSLYRRPEAIRALYGRVPPGTHQETATYCDQTDIYRLQRACIEQGKKYVFLVVFDGMDWQTTWATSTYRSKKVTYESGAGNGLRFQDYRSPVQDFGYFVSSPYSNDCDTDADALQIKVPWSRRGGYQPRLGGFFPWEKSPDPTYLLSKNQEYPDSVTDSSSSATSLTAGIKTFNGAINMTHDCRPVETIAHWVQRTKQFAVGAVTSVPISHATPASAYAQHVTRDDYQDLSRDMLGLRSVSHRQEALPGMDVVLGTGWGVLLESSKEQGSNFVPGNAILTEDDRQRVDIKQGGKYVVAERTAGRAGVDVLREGTEAAIQQKGRLLGFFGTKAGHLPFRTANGDYRPTTDNKEREVYSEADVQENPTLRQMTESAIRVLEQNPNGFWLMVEAGDVDWANHANNLDNSIGAVLSGDMAFESIVKWIESRDVWEESLVIVTADHGHYLHLTRPDQIGEASRLSGGEGE